MHSCWMNVLVSTFQSGLGLGAGCGSWGDRQGLWAEETLSLTTGHNGKARPLLQEASQMSLLRFQPLSSCLQKSTSTPIPLPGSVPSPFEQPAAL